jgi:hypothetical protein
MREHMTMEYEQSMTILEHMDGLLYMCLEQWTETDHSEHREYNTVCMAPERRYLCSTCGYEKYKAYEVKYSERPACVGTLGTTYCSSLEQLTVDRNSKPK